jgi:L-histidine N-alpha-methyltransferase
MSAPVNVTVHSSQFPENVRCDLLESLRSRKIAHKFHYDSVKQAQQWIALHRQFSPRLKDSSYTQIYDSSFALAVKQLRGKRARVIALCCGDGSKDARFLSFVRQAKKEISYVPCDGSLPLVLLARNAALKFVPDGACHPFVCDLQNADDLAACFSKSADSKTPRLITFFGAVPNFEPDSVFPRLASLLRKNDSLLLSANLAPGDDYESGLRRILPQYDNQATRNWLGTFLFDLGFPEKSGQWKTVLEKARGALQRVAIYFVIAKPVSVCVADKEFRFRAGEKIRLFFSYRYSPGMLEKTLDQHGLQLSDNWISNTREEGVFLCGKK